MNELFDIGAYSQTSHLINRRQLYLNTGVPHYAVEVEDLDKIDVEQLGRKICHDAVFPSGVNVDFYNYSETIVKMRTYERGVERETQSCGTGITAVCCAIREFGSSDQRFEVVTPGGVSWLRFEDEEIFLSSKVKKMER